MENEDKFIEEAVACTLIGCASFLYSDSLNQVTRRRTQWCKDFYRERDALGAYKLTMEELIFSDPFSFRQYLRMSTEVFEVLLYTLHSLWFLLSEVHFACSLFWKYLYTMSVVHCMYYHEKFQEGLLCVCKNYKVHALCSSHNLFSPPGMSQISM